MRLLLLLIALVTPFVSGAQAEDVPRVEPGDCIYKADGAHKTTCGYLVVPENRHNPQGRAIKLPFIYVERNNPAKKPNPVLYTGGCPRATSRPPVTSLVRSPPLADPAPLRVQRRWT